MQPIPPLADFLPIRNQRFPHMLRLEQELYRAPLGEARLIETVRAEFRRLELGGKIKPGKTVALSAGSRGVASIDIVLRTLVEEVKRLGATPFLFPAMGSHGGATAEGQKEVLATLGITEATMGCEIRSSMEVVELGKISSGLPVYLDKNASGADAILVVNRVKEHTNFRGPLESGLCKMMAIGMGKHAQAIEIHRYGVLGLRDYMPEVAGVVLAKAPIAAGFAILEDAYHNVCKVAGIAPADIPEAEKRLLEESRRNAPRLPVEDIDLLIVDFLGKNISGTGMDTNVIGRIGLVDNLAFAAPHVRILVCCDLSPETHGSAVGMGNADLITRRFAEKLDWRATYVNCLSSLGPGQARMPAVAQNDREAIRVALDFLVGGQEPETVRAVRIRDTMHLGTMEVSSVLQKELAGRKGVRVAGEPRVMSFDAAGNLPPL